MCCTVARIGVSLTRLGANFRVSTDRQGASGPGLEAQRQDVARYPRPGDELLAEHTKIESGRRHANRPQLLAALEECRRRCAALVIARCAPQIPPEIQALITTW